LSLFTTSLIISQRLALPTKSLLNRWKFCFNGDLKPLDHWIDAIEDATLMFSDQQFVVGLAFLSLDIRSLAVYYWQIVVYLAWFSLLFTTQLLPHSETSSTASKRCIFFMGCTIVLLTDPLSPTGYVSGNTAMFLVPVPAQYPYQIKGVG
jgi:hypothetical protein